MARGASNGRHRRRPRAWWESVPLVPLLLLGVGIGGIAGVSVEDFSLSDWLLEPPRQENGTAIARHFPVCAGSARATCVVDGDTFWLEGTKYRIADINTPETGQPQCAAEAALGRQATSRLAELMSEGGFTLATADRDEDRYGRKLRIVVRNGQSVGQVLVAEGLAHDWNGRRESWC